jgi:hypothetical protein
LRRGGFEFRQSHAPNGARRNLQRPIPFAQLAIGARLLAARQRERHGRAHDLGGKERREVQSRDASRLESASALWLEQQFAAIPERLERLRKSGLKKLSRTDPDSRFLRERGGFTLGYTATLAVSEDHLIVAQRVTQETNDNALLLPMVELVEQQCGEKPQRASADTGFFSLDNLRALEERSIDGYVPDSNLARWLNRGGRLRLRAKDPAHRRMRRKLRDPVGRAIYDRRKAIVEPVNGVLKEQRGMRRFRQRGLERVAVEWALTTTAYNLTRMWRAN